MQIAIPEIDGATEPFIYGGIPVRGQEPNATGGSLLEVRPPAETLEQPAHRPRDEIKLATRAVLLPAKQGKHRHRRRPRRVSQRVGFVEAISRNEGYRVEVPGTLRKSYVNDYSAETRNSLASAANVAYRMTASEYLRLCPYVRDVEKDWGAAPGSINSFSGDLLIQVLHSATSLSACNRHSVRRRSDAVDDGAERIAASRVHGLLHLPLTSVQSRRRDSLRHPRRARVHAGQTDRAFRVNAGRIA